MSLGRVLHYSFLSTSISDALHVVIIMEGEERRGVEERREEEESREEEDVEMEPRARQVLWTAR